MEYIKRFIIGSSFFVVFPLYIIILMLKKNKIKYDLDEYVILSPIIIGSWNVISYIIAQKLGLNLEERIMLISLISYVCAVISAKVLNAYNFSKFEWFGYVFNVFIIYILLWNLVIYNIEKILA